MSKVWGGATSPQLYNALIKTHHITSRKKLMRVRKMAQQMLDYTLIRSGGSPGLMYAEGDMDRVAAWVRGVSLLRYKDYRLLRRPASVELTEERLGPGSLPQGFHEVDSVQGFAAELQKRGVFQWWRKAMEFTD